MIGQFCDQVRFGNKRHAAGDERFMRRADVINFVIDERADGVACVLFFDGIKHESDAAAIEESKTRRRLEEKAHAERVAVEGDRAGEIVGVKSDLSDLVEGHCVSSRENRCLATWFLFSSAYF